MKWEWSFSHTIVLRNSWAGVVYYNKKNKAPILVFVSLDHSDRPKTVFYSLGNWYCVESQKLTIEDPLKFFNKYVYSFEKFLTAEKEEIRVMTGVNIPPDVLDIVEKFDKDFKK